MRCITAGGAWAEERDGWVQGRAGGKLERVRAPTWAQAWISALYVMRFGSTRACCILLTEAAEAATEMPRREQRARWWAGK